MGSVIKFPTKPRVDDYFGGCPICGGNDGCMNINRDHWFICHRHRTKWCFGSNLFSGWREETQAAWQRNLYRLATYREVEPLPCTEEVERAAAEKRSREEIFALLDAPTRARFEAEAKGNHDELLHLIGHVIYGINVSGTNEQLAELISRGYRGTVDFPRSVDTALAIARGESAEAKVVREAREVVQRREFPF